MEIYHNRFLISDDQSLIQADRAHEMLSGTYWAANRAKTTIESSIHG